ISRRIERSGGLGFGKEAELRTERQKTVKAAVSLADSIPEAQLMVFTRKGYMPVKAALLRPHAHIHAFTESERMCRKVTLARGVTARQIDFSEDLDDNIHRAVEMLKQEKVVSAGTPIVVITDTMQRGQAVDSLQLIHA
ncbi:MAG: pyruvate kinase alpha/beta domain-containing protein, partial [Akkermansiaceae bacterium]